MGTVWGTGTYVDDSALCKAARHAGKVPATGGEIIATIKPDQGSYVGSTQNGITSYSWGSWIGAVSIATGSTTCTPPTPSCPADVTSYRGQNGTQLTCSCSSSATNGFVWGTNTYTDDSTLCRAAAHAGRIPLSGGVITAIIRPGQSSYVGSTQNGITSYSYGWWGGSVEFAP